MFGKKKPKTEADYTAIQKEAAEKAVSQATRDERIDELLALHREKIDERIWWRAWRAEQGRYAEAKKAAKEEARRQRADAHLDHLGGSFVAFVIHPAREGVTAFADDRPANLPASEARKVADLGIVEESWQGETRLTGYQYEPRTRIEMPRREFDMRLRYDPQLRDAHAEGRLEELELSEEEQRNRALKHIQKLRPSEREALPHLAA